MNDLFCKRFSMVKASNFRKPFFIIGFLRDRMDRNRFYNNYIDTLVNSFITKVHCQIVNKESSRISHH